MQSRHTIRVTVGGPTGRARVTQPRGDTLTSGSQSNKTGTKMTEIPVFPKDTPPTVTI